jgi:probable F420-dependent oxidoreductase
MGRINVTLGLWQDRRPEEAFETAAAADRLGFGELWIGEMATFDAFALGAAIGLQNRQIRLALGPFAVSVRTPVNIAMGVATVAAAIGRPVNIALGTSSDVVVRDWHGRSREHPARTLEESTQAVALLLQGEKVQFAGTAVRVSGYRLRLPPPESSLSVAAFGPRAVAIAAKYADRVLLNMVTPASAQRLTAEIAAAAKAAGRPTPTVALWLAASVDPGPDALKQMVLVAFARTRPHPEQLRAAMPDEQIAAAVCLAGSIDDVAKRIEEYFDAGIDEVCIAPATADDPGGLRTLTAVSTLPST